MLLPVGPDMDCLFPFGCVLSSSGLIGAAHQSRCPPQQLTDQEKFLFPDVQRNPALHKSFLFFRNFMVSLKAQCLQTTRDSPVYRGFDKEYQPLGFILQSAFE